MDPTTNQNTASHTDLSIIITHSEEVARPTIQLTRYQVEEWMQHRIQRKAYIQRQIANITEYFIAACICFLSAFIYLRSTTQTDYRFTLGIISILWAAFYIMRSIRLSVSLKNHNSFIKKKHIISTLFKDVVLFVVHMQISLYCFKGLFANIYSIVIPMSIVLLTPFLVYNTSTNSCFTFIRLMKFVMSVYRAFMTVLLLLHYARHIKIPFTLIFLPLWLLIFTLALVFIFSFTIVIVSICHSLKNKKCQEEG